MRYECEVCGLTVSLTEAEAYESGWDYPPFIGAWGLISPRTCPDCVMTDTAWWWIMHHRGEPLPDKHQRTVLRIQDERPREDSNLQPFA